MSVFKLKFIKIKWNLKLSSSNTLATFQMLITFWLKTAILDSTALEFLTIEYSGWIINWLFSWKTIQLLFLLERASFLSVIWLVHICQCKSFNYKWATVQEYYAHLFLYGLFEKNSIIPPIILSHHLVSWVLVFLLVSVKILLAHPCFLAWLNGLDILW